MARASTIGQMSIERVLAGYGDVARRSQLEAHGIRRAAIARAVADGGVILVRKGVYALVHVDPEVLTAARHGGEVACAGALRRHGVWILDDAETHADAVDGRAAPSCRPHVWIGPSGRQHAHAACRCRTHHETGERGAGFGVVEVLLAMIQFACCASPEAFFVALESSLHLGLIGFAGLRRLRERLPQRLHELLDLADDRSESGLESLLKLRLRRCGIALAAQVQIEGVGRVDFVLGGRIILEVDGRLNHDGASHRHKDLMRDARAAALGYETLRFDYAMIVHDWPTVLAAIEGRLAVLGAVVQGASAVAQDR